MANLYVAHQGSGQDGQLWFTFTRDGSSWEPDQQVPNAGMSESPSALFFNDRLYVFHQGFGDNGQLWYSSFDGQTWAGDQQVPNAGMTAGPGARVGFNDRLYVFHQGFKDNGQLWYSSFDGQTWAGDQQVANVSISESPSATVFNDGSTSSIRAPGTTASCGIAPSTARPGPETSK